MEHALVMMDIQSKKKKILIPSSSKKIFSSNSKNFFLSKKQVQQQDAICLIQQHVEQEQIHATMESVWGMDFVNAIPDTKAPLVSLQVARMTVKKFLFS